MEIDYYLMRNDTDKTYLVGGSKISKQISRMQNYRKYLWNKNHVNIKKKYIVEESNYNVDVLGLQND